MSLLRKLKFSALMTGLAMLASLATASAQQRAAPMAMDHGMPQASFTLRTGVAQGKMVYIGKGALSTGRSTRH
jgi:nitrite reductase (NO-forming)